MMGHPPSRLRRDGGRYVTQLAIRSAAPAELSHLPLCGTAAQRLSEAAVFGVGMVRGAQ